MNQEIKTIEDQLNDFNYEKRVSAFEKLLSIDMRFSDIKDEVNLHYHTFFSFNAEGWSPVRIAWESKKYGLSAAGIVDFDVLDGMEEFLAAGEILNLKTVVGLETRIFVKELFDKVMSSPNEPGIAYFMASGCYKLPDEGSRARNILFSMSNTARKRNIELMNRINDYLDVVCVDYDNDVIPLTPAGNATERHMLVAYDNKAKEVFDDKSALIDFWASKLKTDKVEIESLIDNTPKLHELMRSKLMKFGSIGYVKPDCDSFPSTEDAISMMLGMDAFPMITWLDGTNPGEEDADEYLELMMSKGSAAINIIPDRNWNIKNSDEKALKVRKLDEVVKAARRLHLPISVGTEMNKSGLPFVDNFNSPELEPYRNDFVNGAMCIYGHTIMARYTDAGFFSKYADSEFGNDIAAKVAFYTKIGKKGLPNKRRNKMSDIIESLAPEDFIR